MTNTAQVQATPSLPDEPDTSAPDVRDADSAQALVIEPAIRIVKSVHPPVVQVGGEVTDTMAVTNTGDVGLDVIGPSDDECQTLTYLGGDDGNGLLDGANSAQVEIWRFTCTRAIGMPQAPATTDENTASVRGIDPLATVTLRDVANLEQPAWSSPALVAKEGGNQDDPLDRTPAERWRYECTSTIRVPTTNVAVVGALGGTTVQPPLQIPVFDAAAAFVEPFTPGVTVVKPATPTQLLGGGPVTNAYSVRNTGDVPCRGSRNASPTTPARR